MEWTRRSRVFWRVAVILFGVNLLLIACVEQAGPVSNDPQPTPTVCTFFQHQTPTPDVHPTVTPIKTLVTTPIDEPEVFNVAVDVTREVHPISPLIYGISVAPTDYVGELGATLNSWGGNPATRYNWELGNAWNAGSDWFYRNGNYGYEEGSVSDQFISGTLMSRAEVRLAVPTLGWVAKNSDNGTCSFPLADGNCGDGGGASCENPVQIADPSLANVPSTIEFVQAWVRHLQEGQLEVRFLAMDNEPELWGYTHYDVHPDCTTYQEILDKYLKYATALQEIAPNAEFTGPVTCCWYYYWNSAAGVSDKAQHENRDFIPWFLDQVRQHDAQTGLRSLHVLDIHYYPEGLYNDDTSPDVSAWRLRSTRSLWDPAYVDESWIAEPVYLIPRMKAILDEYYPGTHLGISEWNFGAEGTLNGALAIADVLGIFGREDVYMAAYWTYPPEGSPGYYAFKLYTNYDGSGAKFGDQSVWARSEDPDVVSSYAALDSATGNLHLMLVNKHPKEDLLIQVELRQFNPSGENLQFQYSSAKPDGIEVSRIESEGASLTLSLPAYSITHLVVPAG